MTLSTRAERLNGTIERRSIGLTDFELRQNGDTLKFSGYASLFDVGYEMYGGPDKGGWVEYVDKGAFNRTLGANPDVVLNINHGEGGTGLPLARTSSGTLQLRTDSKGLRPEASLDLRDPDVQALQVKVERGDVNQMSFAFRTIRQEWQNDETERRLNEVSLDRGDVSIVTNGAQPKTSLQLRNLIEALATVSEDELAVEARAMSTTELSQVSSAYTLLGHLMGMCEPASDGDEPTGGGSGSGMYAADAVDEFRADKYTEADRKKMAKSGDAMPDGSYPIADEEDLKNAIHAVGRGSGDHNAIRRHIMKRAKALGLSSLIPSNWQSDGSMRSASDIVVPRLTLAHARRLATLDS